MIKRVFLFLSALALSSVPLLAAIPVVRPLPDFRLRVNNSASQFLILNDFTRDFEHVDYESYRFDVAWQAQKIDPAANVTLSATSAVSLSPVVAADDGGIYLFDVQDASGQSAGTANTFKSSTFFVNDPWMASDPRINPNPGSTPFVYPLDPQVGGSGVWETFGVFTTVGPPPGNWGNIYINQLFNNAGQLDPDHQTLAQGNPVGILDTLAVALPFSGNFIISAGNQLKGPYVLGFKAENSNSDWDGATVLVSGTILSSSHAQSRKRPDYARDERFENMLGNLTEVGFDRYNPNPLGTGNIRLGQALCSWEHLVGSAAASNVLYGSATVVANGDLPANLRTPNASFVNDHSDNALRVTVWPNRPMVFLKRVRTLPEGVMEAGEVGVLKPGIPYTVDASIASNAPNTNSAPLVSVAVHTEAFTEIAVSTLSQSALPISGEGWVQMRAILEPAQASLYSNPSGVRVSMVVYASPGATGPVDVYIDNVYLYRGIYDTDLARGATRNHLTGGSTTRFPGTVRGDFEAASGEMRGPGITGLGNTNGWFISQGGDFAQAPTGTFIAVSPSSPATRVKSGDTNWLEMTFTSAMQQPEIVYLRTPDLVAPNEGPLTEGIYELHTDYVTPAGASEIPYLIFALSSDNFQSYSRYEIGKPLQGSIGTQGAVRKLRLLSALRNTTGLIALVISYQGNIPQSNSSMYLDNIELHKLNDRQEYWDLSFFDAAP